MAISVMAFLLKPAADRKAAGITVSDLVIKSDNGTEIGKLPSKYFHTNLHHCSDVGRLAFLDAQQRINKINSIARTMMEDGGSVSCIVELLEDPEDAKLNLKPELDGVKRTAVDCRKECEDVKKKFEYWHRVIIHLSQTALDLRAEKASAQKNLHTARERGGKAQDELDCLFSLPPIEEPSYYDELDTAQRLAGPMTSAPKLNRGYIANFGTAWLGIKSKVSRDEDQEYEEAHRAKHERKYQQIIDKERERREAQRKLAEEEVNDARVREATILGQIEQAVKDLSLEEDKLVDAKASLVKASSDLKRLGNHELGLVMKKVDVFLETIERNVQGGSDGNNVSINLGKTSKKRVLEAALQIQGRFSVISDISSAYVKISNTCIREAINRIREAINRMELLSKVDGFDWETKREEFSQWCLEAIDQIHCISKDTSDHIGETMQNRIQMLEQRAIEAAEEAAEDE
ncbi:hypothetical protein B0T10DRAFT_594845 [Thelonectria olida]|uniref:Uncharacterized protein n=1 Tax=Thelonectria olida TaxID=1576542 RepID=A0A9P8VQ89_9HYPO|nr:hypothetical protein B0T10DRAFT_594845 [Thelonectria olida]